MHKQMIKFASAALVLGLGVSAQAGFVNGGFEAGNFSGWTVEHGIYSGGGLGTISWSANASHAYIVGTGNPSTRDPYSPFDNAFNDNYMAQLNEFVPIGSAGLQDATRIRQLATMNAGETDVFINWGAVMEDPQHLSSQEPFFDILVKVNGSTFAHESHVADQGATGGWVAGPASGPDFSQIYYSGGQFHVSGLVLGDSVEVILTTVDCSLSGHAGWAYLDGIGTVAQPPPNVPDGGSTALLLAPALLGLAAFRRKK